MKFIARLSVLALSITSASLAFSVNATTDLTVYTALEADQLKSYAKAI
jgi:hypothetical protein